MNGWYHRAGRMQNQRHAGSEECSTRSPGNLCREFLGQVARNRRKVDAGFFEESAGLHDACSATAAALTRPDVLSETRSVGGLETAADAILQAFEVILSALSPRHE